MSEYNAIFGAAGHVRRGRPPLSDEERERRAAVRKVETKRRNEARRRALAVLGHRHAGELEALIATEYEALSGDARFRAPAEISQFD